MNAATRLRRNLEFGACVALSAIAFFLGGRCFALALHPAALPLSSPFGAYETRAEALSAAHDAMDRGVTCLRVEAVNDTATELQPCDGSAR